MAPLKKQDVDHMAYGIVFLLGLAGSLPWNLFITASGYFEERFYDTWCAESFLNWFTIGSTLCTLLTFTASASVLRPYLPSIDIQILVPLILNALVLFITTLIVKLPSIRGIPMFWLTLLLIALASISSAIFQGGCLTLTAKFPERYTQALMAGQGLAGVLVSSSNFILIFIHPPTSNDVLGLNYTPRFVIGDSMIDISAFSYFLFGFLIMVTSIVAYGALKRREIVQFYLSRDEKQEQRQQLLDQDCTITLGPIQVLRQVKWYAGVVFGVFLVTLAVFPTTISRIQSQNPSAGRLFRDLFTPFLFLLFNLGDLVGRCAAGEWNWHRPRLLMLMTLSRWIFVLLFYKCNGLSSHEWFKHDTFPILFVLACSFTNGYFSSLAMMQSPSVLASVDQPPGAYVMLLALSLGLTCGSSISFLFD